MTARMMLKNKIKEGTKAFFDSDRSLEAQYLFLGAWWTCLVACNLCVSNYELIGHDVTEVNRELEDMREAVHNNCWEVYNQQDHPTPELTKIIWKYKGLFPVDTSRPV